MGTTQVRVVKIITPPVKAKPLSPKVDHQYSTAYFYQGVWDLPASISINLLVCVNVRSMVPSLLVTLKSLTTTAVWVLFLFVELTESLSEVESTACEGQELYLQCPFGTYIFITHAEFGRQLPSSILCPYKHLPEYMNKPFNARDESKGCSASNAMEVSSVVQVNSSTTPNPHIISTCSVFKHVMSCLKMRILQTDLHRILGNGSWTKRTERS